MKTKMMQSRHAGRPGGWRCWPLLALLALSLHAMAREKDEAASRGECAEVPFAPDAAAFARHYYLSGIREVGSELLLREDGTFEWMLAYGAADHVASGRWWRNGGCVGLAEAGAADGQTRPFVLMRPGDSEGAAEMYRRLHEHFPEAGRDLAVWAVELVHGISTDGVEVAMRWEDGVEQVRQVEFPQAVFEPRALPPVAVGLRWPGQDAAFEWIALEPEMRWPLVVEAKVGSSATGGMFPRRLRISGKTLIPAWPGQAERGKYSRE